MRILPAIATALVPTLLGSSAVAGAQQLIVARRPVGLSAAAPAAARDALKDVRVEAITYLSDGLRIHGYLALPDGPGPFPCLIANRGGSVSLNVLTDDTATAWI